MGRKCGRIEWVCLDWNIRSNQFYENLGAKTLDEWTVYQLDEEAFKKLVKEK